MDSENPGPRVQPLVHVPVPGGHCVVFEERWLQDRRAVSVLTVRAALQHTNILANVAWSDLVERLFAKEVSACRVGVLKPRKSRTAGSPGPSAQGIANFIRAFPAAFLLPEVQRRLMVAAITGDSTPFEALVSALRMRREHRVEDEAFKEVNERMNAALAKGSSLTVSAAVEAWKGGKVVSGSRAEAAYRAYWRARDRNEATAAPASVLPCRRHAARLRRLFRGQRPVTAARSTDFNRPLRTSPDVEAAVHEVLNAPSRWPLSKWILTGQPKRPSARRRR